MMSMWSATGSLFLIAPLALAAGTTLTPQTDHGIEVITVGEIVSIDLESRSLNMRSRALETVSGTAGRPTGGISGEIGVQVGIGSPRRGSGRPPIIPGAEPIWPSGPVAGEDTDLPRPPRYIRTRVLIGEDTVIDERGKTLAFESLSVGDRVIVTGRPESDTVEASKIVRQRSAGR